MAKNVEVAVLSGVGPVRGKTLSVNETRVAGPAGGMYRVVESWEVPAAKLRRALKCVSRKKFRRLQARAAKFEAEAQTWAAKAAQHARRHNDARAKVAALEEPQVGWVACPNCEHEFDLTLERGRTNNPNERKEGG